MVVRLGVRPASGGILAGAGYRRILQGQTLHLHTISNAVVSLRAWVRVIYDDGSGQLLTVPETPRSASRVAEDLASTDVVIQNGWVVNAEVEMVTSGIIRGQTYVRLAVEPFGAALLQDYCFSDFGNVSLGTYIQSGPGGGAGHNHVITVLSGAAVASTLYVLPVSNMIRKIFSYAYYFEASSGVATRVVAVVLATPLEDPPSVGALVWTPDTVTLTADENGALYADANFASQNDDGTVAIDSDPTVFPLWITEDMGPGGNYEFRFTATNIDSPNDLAAIYVFAEEWVMP